METLKIEKSKVKKLFKESPEYFKEVLRDTFGKELFSENIIDRINSLQDAYNEVDDATRAKYDREHGYDLSDDILADIEAKLIAKALQGEWEANFEVNQENWYPWFKYSAGSGFGFTFSDFGYGVTYTGVGSRFCFKDEKTSNHFGCQFIEIHRRRLLPKN